MLFIFNTMGHRNMLCTNQMLDMEMDQQGRGHFPSEPCIMLGNIAEYPHPNLLSVHGTTSNPDPHRMAGHHDSSLYFGPPYNGLQHRCSISNVDMSIAGPSSFYNPYMIHSSPGAIFPMSLNCSPSNHLPSQPSSSNHGVDNYESNQFVDCMRNSGKRKNVEGVVQENLLHLNGSASSSSPSPGTQLNTGPQQQEEQTETGPALSDDSAFMAPEYRPNGLVTLAEESERSARSRSNTISLQLDPSVAHNQNQLVQGTYMGHYFHPVSNSWVDQQFGNSARVGVGSAWNHGPAIPYLPGRNVNSGFSEIVNMGGQGYQEAATSRNSAILFHSHSMQQQVHNHHHHPPVPVQALRGHPNYQAQVPLPSYRQPMNNVLHHGPFHTSRDSQEAGPRHHPRPSPSNGLRLYRPHRNGVYQTGAEGRNSPHLRFVDEVAILEIPGYYEVGNFADQHRDMRLDIDDMSYEELLALGERIGCVETGLSEDTVLRHLKTRIHVSSSGKSNSMDRETETCIVCQIGYENQEKIGTLDCGHEYHVDCISKWLSVKNVCPICKTPALTGKGVIG